MKHRPFTSMALLTLLIGMSSSYAISPQGVDPIRGAWGGMLDGENLQLNLYFNEFGPDPDDSSFAVATGGISLAEAGKKKRTKAEIGPMMARYQKTGEGEFEVTVYGNVILDDETYVIKLEGTIQTFGFGVKDDVANGTWTTEFGGGSWSCAHHDRRRVNIPAITIDSDSNYQFAADVYSMRIVDGSTSRYQTVLEVYTNVVTTQINVDIPGNGSVTLADYTDIFSPGVDFVSSFRFLSITPGRPVVGAPYVFTALDIAGQPIEDLTVTDTYVGIELDPPSSVTVVNGSNPGELDISWTNDGNFDSARGDFIQIEVYEQGDGIQYGANGITSNSYTIPADELEPNTTYELIVRSISAAPEGSSGIGLECNAQNEQAVIFVLDGSGQI